MNITFELMHNNFLNTVTDITGVDFATNTVACALCIDDEMDSYLAPETLDLSPVEIAERIHTYADERMHKLEAEVTLMREIAASIAQLPASAIPTRAEMQGHQDDMDSRLLDTVPF